MFAQGLKGCVLAGGTALAGFYAGHRRSEDLDLFTASESDQRAAVLAVKSLAKTGVTLSPLLETNQYFEVAASAGKYRFKTTVVLDANLFRVAHPIELEGGTRVIDLESLLKMKAATLVSRCSEKDLFDLIWLLGNYPDLSFSDLIEFGNQIDAGVDAESVLGSVEGSTLRKDACTFSLDDSVSPLKIYQQILEFREELIKGLVQYLKKQPVPPIGVLVRKLRALN